MGYRAVLKRLNHEIHKCHHPEAEWVVCLHGAGGSIQTWKYQAASLSAHFHLLLIDLRDHGASKNIVPAYDRYTFDIISEDILAVLEDAHITKAHFVTLSFGSVLMQALYKRKPEMVMKMVFIGGIFNANWRIKCFVHLARFFNVFLPYERMYQLFSFLLMPKKNHQLARRIYQYQARKLLPAEYLKWLGLYSEFFKLLRVFHLQPIQQPMLVLMGAEDYLFVPSAQKFVSKKLHARLEILPGAGHICNIDRPEATNKAVLTFLNTPIG